jgi:nucleoside-diphosphate-sugar epimerase
MNGKRILITGASGFLGRQLLQLFNENDCVLLLKSTPQDDLSKRYVWFDNPEELVQSVSAVDVVIHLAAHIPYGNMNESTPLLQSVNVDLTKTLAQAYANARWVFASSVAVYGDSNMEVITAQTVTSPNTAYAHSKWEAEIALSELRDCAIIRFASIIGPGMKPVSMIPKWVEMAKETGTITIWGSGSRMQNYIDVRDAARLVEILAFNNRKGVVLGVAPVEHSNKQVAEVLSDLTRADLIFTQHADEKGLRYDDRETHRILGFIPKFELRDSIRDMIAE